MTQASIDTSDQTILSAWQQGLSETSKNATFKQALLQQQGELLPCFVDHYQKLKALPRSMRRALQRQWRRSLAGIALLFALGAMPVLAATINVGGSCTLVRAIVAANNDTTASGNCSKGSGADRVVLPPNSTVTLRQVNNTRYSPTGLPVIRSDITIVGNGGTIRRARSAPSFRILAMGHGDLTLRRTTVSGGRAAGDRSGGGGIINFGDTLTLTNSTISGNIAGNDGGGGVLSYGALTVTNSNIIGNTTSREAGVPFPGARGGGVSTTRSATFTNSTISGNTAEVDGGGIHSCCGYLTLTNSTVSDNVAVAKGGGIYTSGAGLIITNSTISGNSGSNSGGVFNNSTADIINCTISGNTADQEGGGIHNFAGIMTLARSLLSGNSDSRGREVFNARRATIDAGNFNLFGHRGLTNRQAFRGFMPGPTDITATSNGNRPTALRRILNTTLANNGGPTRTHALVAGSPAIDTVIDGTCPPPNQDQRGVRRPQDGNNDGAEICDTGSFERRPRE